MKNFWIPPLIRIAAAVFVSLYIPQRAHSFTAHSASTLPVPTTAAQNAYAGCLVAPDDSVFNTPVDTLPVHVNSAEWISQSLAIGSVGVSFGGSWDVNLVDNSVTPTAMTFHYTTASNGVLYPLLTGNHRTREGGSYTTDGNNDHHMITLNRQTCHWYETYQDNLTGSVTPTPAPYAASGWDYLGSSYTQPSDGTTDAAGLPLMPLTVHLSEMQAGAIHHAMRFTSCAGCISHVALWPATGSTAYSASSAPMGSRWRLKASYDDSKLSAKARIITTALKTYGMILADIGGISQIQIAQDLNLDPSASAAFGEVGAAKITQDQFEIVDESGLMISANSSQARGGTLSSAPVLVGTTSPVIFPQSGQTYQLPSWVNGSSDQTAVWSMLSGAGSITSAGLYTAPTGVTAPVPFVLRGVNEIDSLNPVIVSGYVMPAGTMRIDVGDISPYTDTKGNSWLADNLGVLTGSFMNNDDTWPVNTWNAVGSPPDGQYIYGWSKYTWGDDIQYGPFIVPNGNYSVQFWMAVSCSGTYSETQIFDNGLTRGGTVGLEANGAMTLFSLGAAIKDACLTPAMPTIQALVTDNVLRIAVRSTSVGDTQQAPFLNALIITPEAAPQIALNPANLTFDNQQVGTKSTAQLVTLTNSGAAAIANSITVSNGANFSLSTKCPASIPANTSCTVAITFTPMALGNQSAILTVVANSGTSPQPVSISGTGTGWPKMVIRPSSLVFGNQQIGTSASQVVTITNSGTAPLTDSLTVLSSGDFYTTSTCPANIPPSTSCIINVKFQPYGLGNRTGTLVVASNTAGSPQPIPLSGTGTGLPKMAIQPGSLVFGNQQIGTSASQVITITNSGTAPLTNSIAVSSGGDFYVTSTCPASISTNASCTIAVMFKPTQLGNRTGTLVVASNAVGSPQSLPLSGTGIGLPGPTGGSGVPYAYSREITIHHNLVPNTDQSNFPLLFSGTFPYLAAAGNGGGVQNTSGYDIVFASDAAGVNKLNFERRSYNASTGQVQYWVQVPTVSHSTDTVIYLLYGATVSLDPSNKTGTWSSNYKGVWHMDETSGTVLADSTLNANSAVKGSATNPAPVIGYVGGGQQFVNTGNLAASALSPSTNITSGGITISAIMYPTNFNAYGGIYRRSSGPGDNGSAAQENLMINNVGGDITYGVGGMSVTWPMGPNYTTAYNQNAWNFITLTHNFSTNAVSCYLNGKLLPVKALAVPSSAANDIVILGNRAYGVGNNSFPGTLDEIRVSSGVLSQDWIATEVNNQSNPGSFYSVSP